MLFAASFILHKVKSDAASLLVLVMMNSKVGLNAVFLWDFVNMLYCYLVLFHYPRDIQCFVWHNCTLLQIAWACRLPVGPICLNVMCRQLYEVAMRNCDDVKFVTFDAGHGYGHKHLHKSPELIPVIRLWILI